MGFIDIKAMLCHRDDDTAVRGLRQIFVHLNDGTFIVSFVCYFAYLRWVFG